MNISPGHLGLEELQAVHRGGVSLELEAAAYDAIATSAAA